MMTLLCGDLLLDLVLDDLLPALDGEPLLLPVDPTLLPLLALLLLRLLSSDLSLEASLLTPPLSAHSLSC